MQTSTTPHGPAASFNDYAGQTETAQERAISYCETQGAGHKVTRVTQRLKGRDYTTYEVSAAHISFEWMAGSGCTVETIFSH